MTVSKIFSKAYDQEKNGKSKDDHFKATWDSVRHDP